MRTNIFKFLVLVIVASSTQASNKDTSPFKYRAPKTIWQLTKVVISLERGVKHYIKTGQKSEELQEALDVLQLPELFQWKWKILPVEVRLACLVGVKAVIWARRTVRLKKDKIAWLLEKLCVSLNFGTQPVCHGLIKINANAVTYIIDYKKKLSAMKVCSIVLQNYGFKDINRIDWEIGIPPRKEGRKHSQKTSKSNALKILQLTDIHYDPGYAIGSNSACNEPLCCQAGSKPSNPNNAAGYWGNYHKCDTSWDMLTDSLDHIVNKHRDLDFVYFTGDIIDHKVWATDATSNRNSISVVLQLLKSSFKSIPVYPILGNHEPQSVDLFSSDGINDPSLSTQWLFDLSAKQWQTWLPAHTRDTILRGGYYTVLVKPGFRIVALNSNVCYIYNLWLLYDDVDPFDQLKWLVEILSNAEDNGEIVHILSHIPPGDEYCLLNWRKEYAKIINRFGHIIAAQFNGHTHFDETVIFFNLTNPSQAINIAFNGGSLTSYEDLNLNYKIYHIDSVTMEVLDYESWTYNLTKANLTPNSSPQWYKLYSFKNAYRVDNLRPQEIAALTTRIAKNPYLSDKYFRFKHRRADTALAKGCNDDCKIKNLCYMVTTHPENNFQCEYLKEMLNSAKPKLVDYMF